MRQEIVVRHGGETSEQDGRYKVKDGQDGQSEQGEARLDHGLEALELIDNKIILLAAELWMVELPLRDAGLVFC